MILFVRKRRICCVSLWLKSQNTIKKHPDGVSYMCKAVEDYAEKRAMRERIETIKSFIKDGSLSIEKIAEIVKLPIEDVQKIGLFPRTSG